MKQQETDVRVARWDAKLRADALLVPVLVSKGKAVVSGLKALPRGIAKQIDEIAGRYHGAKQPGAIDDLILPAKAPFGRIAVVCLGEKKPVKRNDVRNAAGLAASWCVRHHVRKAAVAVDALTDIGGREAAALWVEGAVLASFRFLSLRSRPPDDSEGATNAPTSLCFATASARSTQLAADVARARVLAEAANLARSISHEPPNVINPITLANRARQLARRYGLRCRILDERQMKARKMGALLAVAGGSANRPRMIILEHVGGRPKAKPVLLVGKAVTLDTGGYSLKPAASIPEMKYDKCGGLAVLGALVAAARLRLPRRIVGIIGAVENMISGEAYRPGDIVRAANGKTIEVHSTDAEGRLVLADCLTYGEKTYRPAAMIDIATLTGACKVALGEACAAVLSADDSMATGLIEAGERTGERLWRMPLWQEYREQISGTDGDLKNTGGPSGGCMTAAMFLNEFVGEKTPWAHLDIAGVAYIAKQTPICPIGATGFGVRLLVDYIQHA